MDSEHTYTTSDLYLTAYLKSTGFKYIPAKENGRFVFNFDKSDDLTNTINLYLSENGTIEPLVYANAIKNLKNYIHSKI